jgi:hypothetical protein
VNVKRNEKGTIVLLSLALWGLAVQAVGQEYYTAFQTFVATNSQDKHDWILAPHLVDTNNTALKTTNVVLSVGTAKGLARIGGVRLGMTMEEVVATWGKPIRALRWCQGGGPHLNYTGAKVIFDGTNNCVRMLYLFGDGIESTHGEQGLTVQSNIEHWIRVLGRPARRGEVRAGYMASATYEHAQTTMTLHFAPGGAPLVSIQLEQPPKGKQNERRN